MGGPCLESRAGERTTVCASQYSAQPDATPKMFCTSNDVVIVVGPSETPLIRLQATTPNSRGPQLWEGLCSRWPTGSE